LNIKPNLSLVLKVRPNLIQRINSQVLEKAKQDLQFLLVYLHSPSHADTGRFCRTTLSSPELVRRSRFL
jgi:FAS-associated factor 2